MGNCQTVATADVIMRASMELSAEGGKAPTKTTINLFPERPETGHPEGELIELSLLGR